MYAFHLFIYLFICVAQACNRVSFVFNMQCMISGVCVCACVCVRVCVCVCVKTHNSTM